MAGRFRVGVVGASGYTGAELLRLLTGHPHLELAVATGDTQAGNRIADLYPSLAAAYGGRCFEAFSPEALDGVDLAFVALPHGASGDVVAALRGRVGHVVDLGSDFRLRDPALYPRWYGQAHRHPELLAEFRYGLPEWFRDRLRGAELIAATGCNVAAATLALAPLLRAGLVDGHGLVVDVVTGVSGAGRPPKAHTTFCAVDEDVTAYGLLDHRHTPEMEQALSDASGRAATVLFTPHLAPLNRGILATCYARPTGTCTTEEVLECLAGAYIGEPFLVVDRRSPSTKATLGSNAVHLTARADPRTGVVLAIAALDNLVKGASGMALQCANLALELPETTGLPVVGVYP
jgi:N-acetyl-gamma-glutamyl-phosphate reductase